MHLLQFIKAPSTGIHCHLALVVEGRLLSSSSVSSETLCSLSLIVFYIITLLEHATQNYY